MNGQTSAIDWKGSSGTGACSRTVVVRLPVATGAAQGYVGYLTAKISRYHHWRTARMPWGSCPTDASLSLLCHCFVLPLVYYSVLAGCPSSMAGISAHQLAVHGRCKQHAHPSFPPAGCCRWSHEFRLHPPFPSCDTLKRCRFCFILLFSRRRCFRCLDGNSNWGKYFCTVQVFP